VQVCNKIKSKFFYRLVKITKKVLFLGKNNDTFTFKALDHLRLIFTEVKDYLGDWGDKLPAEASLLGR